MSHPYFIFCEKNYEWEEIICFFFPISVQDAPLVEALHYMITYADWTDCEGDFSTFHMDTHHPKSLLTVKEMIQSATVFDTHFPLYQILTGSFQWPFPFSTEDVRTFSPLHMAQVLNQYLTGGRISLYFA